MERDGSIRKLSKKRAASLMREKRKIFRNLNGIRNMNGLPSAMIVVDPRKEKTAVKEARKVGIPVVAILDTDCDPDLIDIRVPGNDDALRSIQVLLGVLTEAIKNGRQAHSQFLAEEEKRRAEDDARAEADKKKRLEQQKQQAAERAELEKVIKKAREERARRLADEEAVKAREADAKPEQSETPVPAPATPGNGSGDAALTGETKPGPLGPEPTADS